MKTKPKPGSTGKRQSNGLPAEKLEATLTLPEPFELATLAAILLPGAEPDKALTKAMELYIEAVLFVRELRPLCYGDLIRKFGSRKQRAALFVKPIVQAIEAQWNETLELEPEKNDDPVRQFLAERGLKLKDARSVFENIRRRCDRLPVPVPGHPQKDAAWIVAEAESEKDGKKIYRIPKFILDEILEDARLRRSESRRKGAKTRQGKPPVN